VIAWEEDHGPVFDEVKIDYRYKGYTSCLGLLEWTSKRMLYNGGAYGPDEDDA
jgi:hypothetical protein